MKKILALIVLLFAILFGIIMVQTSLKNKNSIFTKTATATIDTHKFNLIIARTAKEKETGLSERNNLDKDAGMFFLFDRPDYYSFWMKNMKFPIDIIFIKDGVIVTIYENIIPPKTATENIPVYQPESPIDSALEINAGLSSKYGFTKGDKIKFENL